MKKMTVEDCRVLCVFELVRGGVIQPSGKGSGTKSWDRAGLFKMFDPEPFCVAYEVYPVEPYTSEMRVSFTSHRRSDGPLCLFPSNETHIEIRQKIPIVSTQPNYGGYRFWFLCPVCQKRVAKIYLPWHCDRFACRHCHDLTYRSSQMAHQYDAIYCRQAKASGGSIKDVKKVFNDKYGSYSEIALAMLRSHKKLTKTIDSLSRSG